MRLRPPRPTPSMRCVPGEDERQRLALTRVKLSQIDLTAMTYSEIFKNDNALAERIRRTFDLGSSALPLQRIGTGFKSVVLGSPAGLVFRVALNEKAQTGHRREYYILSKLKPLLPVEVPEILGYSDASDDFPFGVMMQRKIEGRNLSTFLKRSLRIEPFVVMTGELILAIQSISREDLPELPASTAPPPEETWFYAHAFLKAGSYARRIT